MLVATTEALYIQTVHIKHEKQPFPRLENVSLECRNVVS